MKKLLFVILLSAALTPAFADHLKGGFFTYEYIGAGTTNTSFLKYRIRFTEYMKCDYNAQQVTNPVPITFFDDDSHQIYQTVDVPISSEYDLGKATDDQCITGNQARCYYHIVVYDFMMELPSNAAGYTISYQRCCRIIDIKNMPSSPASSTFGNTYSITIPGSAAPLNAQLNSSPQFLVNDTGVVCKNSFFQLPFIASDKDGDSLSYMFCSAWTGGGTANGNGPTGSTPNPAAAPPYALIPYAAGFSGGSPLGLNVNLDPQTGLISGISPSVAGEYVVCVCINEFRQGVLIATSRKELHLTIGDCSPIQATLDPSYITCDGLTLTFANQTNAGVQSYFWDFGVTSQTNDTSNLANPTFPFPDSGTYTIKLVVNRGQSCGDSTTAIAKVYPGFFPGFTTSGICVNKPTNFFDTTYSRYGVVNSWSWDFGDLNTTTDISNQKNPSYTYNQTGTKNVQFTVTNSKGCIATIHRDVAIIDKPPLSVFPKDTLICNGDNLQLNAVGNGIFSWSPGTNIINANTANPTVNPTTTTNYSVLLDDNGCVNRDTIKVRVVDFVTLAARADTIICTGDSVQLYAATDGLSFSWSPSATIGNPNALFTSARPANTPATYRISSSIGHCTTTDDVTVTLVPYPGANAGADAVICFDGSAQLQATIIGSSFSWSPASSLNNPNILNPIATPKNTTKYILSVTDNIGCPKPGFDSVTVTVLPKINPFAGHDTAVVVGQPLQFNATGGTIYAWSPGTGLNHINVPNPIGIYSAIDTIRYKVLVTNQNGCIDSAFVTVRVFDTKPQIFVPTAFTPNGDGKNDYFRPIAVGISHFDYFRVFNRWGQLVFTSDVNEQGWDGNIGGKPQPSGTFVWIVRGTDFTGKVVFLKGTVVLIR